MSVKFVNKIIRQKNLSKNSSKNLPKISSKNRQKNNQKNRQKIVNAVGTKNNSELRWGEKNRDQSCFLEASLVRKRTASLKIVPKCEEFQSCWK